ncbi:MAG TPA: hypothetical protein VHM26_16770 [Chitinophagaceae bacterium]|jgi:hypothetical protein|nr:hypothetical protein [Chitinophagaceae bacterium]
MRLFIAAALSLAFVACNNDSDKPNTNGDTLNTNDEHAALVATTIEATKVDAAQVPATLKFRGKPYEVWQWKDSLGDNLLVATLVEAYNDKQKNEYDEEGQTAELHAFHYVKKDADYKLLWKISDAEKACPFDITCGFIKNGITVTDLDKDGIAETTVPYKLACRSDVSPADMKIVMHEDTAKYALRGLMWVRASESDLFTITDDNANLESLPKKKDEYDQLMQSFGRYQNEKEFATAPPAFLKYAKDQWMKHVIEKFD